MNNFFDYELSESYNKRICPNHIENLTHENLRRVRPGLSLPPKYFDQVLGRKVNKDLVNRLKGLNLQKIKIAELPKNQCISCMLMGVPVIFFEK